MSSLDKFFPVKDQSYWKVVRDLNHNATQTIENAMKSFQSTPEGLKGPGPVKAAERKAFGK
jgi:hypothetical protein